MAQARSPRTRCHVGLAVGVVLALATVPAGAGSLSVSIDPSTTTTTTGPASTTSSAEVPTTTSPVVAWPEPAGHQCSPNWYQGSLEGAEVEHGEAPAAAEGAAQSVSDLGAVVAITSQLVHDGGETDYSIEQRRVRITVGDRTHELTTAPHPAYGHYPNRGGGPFEVEGGTLRIASHAGRTWVFLAQSTSGASGSFGWELGSCVPAPDTGVREAPRGAAVPGPVGYTG